MTWQLYTLKKSTASAGTCKIDWKHYCCLTHDIHMLYTCNFSIFVILFSTKSYYAQRPLGPVSNFELPSKILVLVSVSPGDLDRARVRPNSINSPFRKKNYLLPFPIPLIRKNDSNDLQIRHCTTENWNKCRACARLLDGCGSILDACVREKKSSYSVRMNSERTSVQTPDLPRSLRGRILQRFFPVALVLKVNFSIGSNFWCWRN